MTYCDEKLSFFLQHRLGLIAYATGLLGVRAHAEDVVQEAYIRFAAAGTAEGEILKPIPYLYRIVRNLATDHGQSRARERLTELDDGMLASLCATTPSPEHDAGYRQELRLVAEALAALPERTRIAFEMHRLGGYKLHDIAKRLGISVTLAHQLIQKAMVQCASKLSAAE